MLFIILFIKSQFLTFFIINEAFYKKIAPCTFEHYFSVGKIVFYSLLILEYNRFNGFVYL